MINTKHAVQYEYGYPSSIFCGWNELRRVQDDANTSIFYLVKGLKLRNTKWFDHSHKHLAWRYFRKLSRN